MKPKNINEIIKALRQCSEDAPTSCDDCPYEGMGHKCLTQLAKDALELILQITEEG